MRAFRVSVKSVCGPVLDRPLPINRQKSDLVLVHYIGIFTANSVDWFYWWTIDIDEEVRKVSSCFRDF